MSFVVQARRVRDPRLPPRRRLSALSSCVVLVRPFGFHGGAGRRVPDPRVVNPHLRLRPGDLATGARYRLQLWAGRRALHPTRAPADSVETAVERCVRACVERGFGAEERALLGNCLHAVEQRLAQAFSTDEYRRWRELSDVARLVRQATADCR